MSTLLERDGLLAAWRGLTANLTGDLCDGYELDERGRVVRNQPPSGRRQIAATDIYCQVTEQLGHLAGMSVAVATPFSGIRVPDVVWLPPGSCEGFDYSHPLPVVPDLCAEVLPDSLATHDVDHRVNAYLAGSAREVIVVDRYGPGVLHKQLSCEWLWAFVTRVV